MAAPKSLPAHPFNALIFQILRGCVQSCAIFLSLHGICFLIATVPVHCFSITFRTIFIQFINVLTKTVKGTNIYSDNSCAMQEHDEDPVITAAAAGGHFGFKIPYHMFGPIAYQVIDSFLEEFAQTNG